jgi:proline dehydrogenase
VLRQVVLGIAERRSVRKLATGGVGRRVALRFVAGETLDQALEVIRSLNARGAEVSIDHLGENVTDPSMAERATQAYEQALNRIAAEALRANVSVKLTQMGLDVDGRLAYANVARVTSRARETGTTVTLDMEDHRYTDRTIDACLRLTGAFPGHVGIALQAYLKRTPADLERLIDAGAHVRLCKGAYREPRAIAHRRRSKVDEAFASLATRLMSSDAYAEIATHDEDLIRHAVAQAERRQRARETHEFQMLYGVRRELQDRLLAEGHRVRVYVPFGDQWYAYLTRRIAEKPANVRFFVEALLRK